MRTLHLRTEYDRALREILLRVQDRLKGPRPAAFPIRMYIAGGAALHVLTGERVTEDVDATFSKRVLFTDEIQVAYRDPDGRARLMYLDRNYNATLGLLHERAYEDSEPVNVPDIDRRLLEIRILSPTDLAVSKLARFTEQDRRDIELLAKKGLIESRTVRNRADEALKGYVGNPAPVKTSIDIACCLIDALNPKG